MPSQPTSTGIVVDIVVGSVAASATTGALVAIGHRLGSAAIPFAAIGAVVLHRTASAGAVGLVFTGLVLHIAIVFAWSALFVWSMRRIGVRPAVAASGVALVAFAFSWLVARFAGGGLSSVLPLGDRLVYALILAIALVVGMRFAFSPSRNA